MRFVLNDPKKADEAKIEDIPSVKGMFTNAGQFQVIIGNDVAVFYNEFVNVSESKGLQKKPLNQRRNKIKIQSNAPLLF